MRHHRHYRRRHHLLATAGMTTAGAGLLLVLALSVPSLAGSAAATPTGQRCDPAHAVTSSHFTVNGRTVASLHGVVGEGDKVAAFFTIATGCRGVAVALVSHTAPDPFFVPGHVKQQQVFDAVKATFDGGAHTMGPVQVPPCDFQVDFEALGTRTAPGHTYSAATGGTAACGPGTKGTTTTTAIASVLPTSLTTPTSSTKGTLPVTGGDTDVLIGVAFALLVSGGAMIALSGRRSRRLVGMPPPR